MKPASISAVSAAAAGSASSVATDPVPPLLVPQHSSSSLGSGGTIDGEEEVLAGLVDQITRLTTKRSSKESGDTEGISNLPKESNEQTKGTLDQIDSSFSASSSNVKKAWCLWMEANVKDIDPSFGGRSRISRIR